MCFMHIYSRQLKSGERKIKMQHNRKQFLSRGKKIETRKFLTLFLFSLRYCFFKSFFVDKNLSSQSVAYFVRIYFRRIDEAAVKREYKKNSSKSLTILLAGGIAFARLRLVRIKWIFLFPSIPFYFSFVPFRVSHARANYNHRDLGLI